LTIRVEHLVLVLAAIAVAGFLAAGALLIWSASSSDYSGGFDLSGVTDYEPCLQAPGSCPCLRKRDCAERLKEFGEHPVFWLGENFEGLPLTSVDIVDYGARDRRRVREVSLSYGACVPSGDSGCEAPLSILIARYCESSVDAGRIVAENTRFEVRSAEAYTPGSSADWLFLRTSNLAVYIRGGTESANAGQVALNLVRANLGPPVLASDPFERPVDDCYAGRATPSVTPLWP
jgi:hypothetical protein